MPRSGNGCCCCRRPDGSIAGALCGDGAMASADELSLWDAAALPERLPAGKYRVATPRAARPRSSPSAGCSGSYRLSRYRAARRSPAGQRADRAAGADVRYARPRRRPWDARRDLINAPANQLGRKNSRGGAGARHAHRGDSWCIPVRP